MKDWFNSLQSREQVFVGVGGVVVVMTLVWGLLWLPFDKGHEALRADVDTWQRSISELQPLRAAIQNGATPGAVAVANSRLANSRCSSSVRPLPIRQGTLPWRPKSSPKCPEEHEWRQWPSGIRALMTLVETVCSLREAARVASSGP